MEFEYTFNDRMKLSDGDQVSADVKSILLRTIPGALQVHKSHPLNDRAGVDWWVEMSGARFLGIDAKVRENDWAKSHPEDDDLALETWSVVESSAIGWTRDTSKKCDYILWVWKDTGRFCLMPFPLLCKAFSEHWEYWASTYKTARQKTPMQDGRRYHSECVFVPRAELWECMQYMFGGSFS